MPNGAGRLCSFVLMVSLSNGADRCLSVSRLFKRGFSFQQRMALGMNGPPGLSTAPVAVGELRRMLSILTRWPGARGRPMDRLADVDPMLGSLHAATGDARFSVAVVLPFLSCSWEEPLSKLP